MHAILTTTLPRFLLEHKNSSHVFEICLLSEDSPWMKLVVMVKFEIFICFNIVLKELRNSEFLPPMGRLFHSYYIAVKKSQKVCVKYINHSRF